MLQRAIKKAVFPVAGLGTRLLPQTKATPKELLPVVDKPIIQYAVEEAVAAGIKEMIFITGRSKRAIADHFDKNHELEEELASKGKDELLGLLRGVLPADVSCLFIRQPQALGLGHAVLCAEPAVGDAPFAVILPDDLFLPGSKLPTEDLVAAYRRTGASAISVCEVPASQVSKYGIVSCEEFDKNGLSAVRDIVEKPPLELAPSRMASIGRYVFHPEIFSVLRGLEPGYGGEIQLADAISSMAQNSSVVGVHLNLRRYDCGSKLGYLEAVLDAALAHPEFGDKFRTMMELRSRGNFAAE